MKKVFAALIAVVFLGACTEVPVKEKRECSRVVDVEMTQAFMLWIPRIHFRYDPPNIYLILRNGKKLQRSYDYYAYDEFRNRAPETGLLDLIKQKEIGRIYCSETYEPVGK